eukprot:840684-Pleurochrysis_carterae.AAC.2
MVLLWTCPGRGRGDNWPERRPSGRSGGVARGEGGGGTAGSLGRLRVAGTPEGAGEGCAYM